MRTLLFLFLISILYFVFHIDVVYIYIVLGIAGAFCILQDINEIKRKSN